MLLELVVPRGALFRRSNKKKNRKTTPNTWNWSKSTAPKSRKNSTTLAPISSKYWTRACSNLLNLANPKSFTTRWKVHFQFHYVLYGSIFLKKTNFFFRNKGDYHRYLAEFKSGDARDTAAKHAQEAYETASEIMQVYSQRFCCCEKVKNIKNLF